MTAVGLNYFTPIPSNQEMLLCSIHFEDGLIFRDSSGRYRLNCSAVPTKFLPTQVSLAFLTTCLSQLWSLSIVKCFVLGPGGPVLTTAFGSWSPATNPDRGSKQRAPTAPCTYEFKHHGRIGRHQQWNEAGIAAGSTPVPFRQSAAFAGSRSAGKGQIIRRNGSDHSSGQRRLPK